MPLNPKIVHNWQIIMVSILGTKLLLEILFKKFHFPAEIEIGFARNIFRHFFASSN
jgi:hypothetical protein